MAAEAKHAIDRYILQAFMTQLKRVFGVQPYFSMRSDFQDAIDRITSKKSDRAVDMCFVRPVGFALKRDGFRANALQRSGLKASIASTQTRDGVEVPEAYNVIHPVPTDIEYEVTFTVSTYTMLSRLWTIWSQCSLQNSLSFQIIFQDVPVTVSCKLSDEMAAPEQGQTGSERTDQMRVVGNIVVSGYTAIVTDPHVVPVILHPELDLATTAQFN